MAHKERWRRCLVNKAFVYLWYDGNERKFYLGSSIGKDSNYAHSSRRMPRFKMNTIPKGFRRRILAEGSYDDMIELEKKLQRNRDVVNNPKYYNAAVFPAIDPKINEGNTYGKDWWSKLTEKEKKEQGRKVSEGLKKRIEEHGHFGSNKGRTDIHTEEWKKYIGTITSKAQRGKGNSQYGTMWITNGVENTKIKKGNLMPQGWRAGRVMI